MKIDPSGLKKGYKGIKNDNWPSTSTPKSLPKKKKWKYVHKKDLYKRIHSSFIHCKLKLKHPGPSTELEV